MKPSPFRYYAPNRIEDVVDLLVEHGDDAKLLAGGQSLVPMMSLRLAAYPHVVDLGRVEGLDAVERRDGRVRVGAMVRQAVAETDPTVAAIPLLARAIPHIGHFQIRNRGTVGGSIAHADPASELPAVALALGAEMEATGPAGVRRIPAASFFESTWQTSLAPDEVLTAVEFPVVGGGDGLRRRGGGSPPRRLRARRCRRGRRRRRRPGGQGRHRHAGGGRHAGAMR